MKKISKVAGVAMATLMAVGGNPAAADNQNLPTGDNTGHPNGQNGQNANVSSDRSLARQKLIDALKNMKNSPEKIEFHSAMCYKMAMPPETIDYTCPDCGENTTHQYDSTGGAIVRQIASVRRALGNLPVKITLDESSLCQKCDKNARAELHFTSQCGKCQTTFTWQIINNDELDKLGWLFLNYPVTAVDDGAGRGDLINPEKVKSMVEFVSGCTFCPKCIKELQLNYEE